MFSFQYTNLSTLETFQELIKDLGVFTVMKIQVVISVMMLRIDMVGYQHFRGPCCLHLYFTLKMEVAWSSIGILQHHYTASQPT
jgi:hypothetical protein